MKIRALQPFHVPDLPAFEEGEERTVPDELGSLLIARGHAEEVKPKSKAAKASESK